MIAWGRLLPPGSGGGEGDETEGRFLLTRPVTGTGATEVRVRERERETPAEEGERRFEGAGRGWEADAEPGMNELSAVLPSIEDCWWCPPFIRESACADCGLNG
jgi:hypothetical protein